MALVFVPITILLFMHYMRERTPKRLHLFAAFTFASLGFLVGLLEEIILASSGSYSDAVLLFRFFDMFEMIGVFLFFVFLTDFIESQKKYIVPSFLGLLIVIVTIFVSPLEIVKQGLSWSEIRDVWAGTAIILYWLIHFGVISYQFWKYSRFLEEKGPRVRIQFMASGGVFAMLAYIAVILFKLAFPHLLAVSEAIGVLFAIIAGILFYLGAETPTWFKSLIV